MEGASSCPRRGFLLYAFPILNAIIHEEHAVISVGQVHDNIEKKPVY
jgi:hypothetical protein